ncbi:MAG: IS630 family transposase, partial [Planctomycetia bacterium]|nr:IS630 family transposase [Planctomycetia bacterium]
PPPRRGHARRRRLHPPRRGRAADPPRGVRRRPRAPGHLQPAAQARLLRAPTPAPAPRRRPRGAGGVQKKLPEILDKIATDHPTQTLEVWFEDEARFGQKGTLTTVWADRGSRPRAPKQGGFQSLHLFTAVCPATGAAEGLIAEQVNADTTQKFLDLLSATLPPTTHVALVWDGAGYHTANDLVVPANLTLVPLPPRSPELNPVENLWHYLRSHYLSNRTYANLDAVESATAEAWRATCLGPERIQTVCACPYLKTGS